MLGQVISNYFIHIFSSTFIYSYFFHLAPAPLVFNMEVGIHHRAFDFLLLIKEEGNKRSAKSVGLIIFFVNRAAVLHLHEGSTDPAVLSVHSPAAAAGRGTKHCAVQNVWERGQ